MKIWIRSSKDGHMREWRTAALCGSLTQAMHAAGYEDEAIEQFPVFYRVMNPEIFLLDFHPVDRFIDGEPWTGYQIDSEVRWAITDYSVIQPEEDVLIEIETIDELTRLNVAFPHLEDARSCPTLFNEDGRQYISTTWGAIA